MISKNSIVKYKLNTFILGDYITMSNIIAVIWDFDKTLINGYMEEPLFKKFGVDSKTFWQEVQELPEKYLQEQNVKVNPDTIYLNHIINYTKNGVFRGLNNEMLRGFGRELKFYEGVPEIFDVTKKLINEQEKYREYDIRIEHYIVSTGLTEIIRGSIVSGHVNQVWGCEFIECETKDGQREISEIGYTIDNTTKTRALFEINKGVGILPEVTVNTFIPKETRRVHFINMVYVADGPSDIPAFSVINQNGGATFAVYPRGDKRAIHQVEQMRRDGRVNMFAEADYSEDSMARMWLCDKIEEFAERIRTNEKAKLEQYTSSGEIKHLID